MKNNINEPLSGALTEPFNATPQEMEQIKAAIKKHQEAMSPEEKRQVEFIRMEYKIKIYLDAEITEDEIVIVGEFLKMYLNKINIKQDKFANHIGISPSNFNEILSGQRSISIELSVILGQLFRIDPKVWLQIQLKNDYILIEKTKDEYKKKNVRYAMAV